MGSPREAAGAARSGIWPGTNTGAGAGLGAAAERGKSRTHSSSRSGESRRSIGGRVNGRHGRGRERREREGREMEGGSGQWPVASGRRFLGAKSAEARRLTPRDVLGPATMARGILGAAFYA